MCCLRFVLAAAAVEMLGAAKTLTMAGKRMLLISMAPAKVLDVNYVGCVAARLGHVA